MGLYSLLLSFSCFSVTLLAGRKQTRQLLFYLDVWLSFPRDIKHVCNRPSYSS